MEIKITSGNLEKIAQDLKEKLLYNHISNITMVNSHDFIFSFSMYRKGKLFVSLNHQAPFLSLVSDVVPTGTIVGTLNDTLRKMVKDGNIKDIHTINNDRIIAFEYTKVDDLYEKKNRTLIFELIPHRQNLIILEEGKILYASHYSGLDTDRPVLKGFEYHPIENKTNKNNAEIDLNALRLQAEDYFLKSKQERNAEKYKSLITHIKSRIKSLNGKLLVLNRAIEKAKEELSYQDIGNMLLAYAYDKDELNNYIKKNKLDYDSSLTPGNNAEKYFKKYKKAKRTIEMDQIEIAKTHDEIANLEDVTSSIDNNKASEGRKNTAAKPVRQVSVASAEVVANAVAVENVAAVTPEVSEPAAPQDDTPIYACSTDLDDMCYIDYQFLEYYSDELEDSEYGDIR